MAVRHFNGTSDDLTTSAGAAGSMTYGTFAFLVKQHTNRTLEQCAFALLTSGSANLRAIAGTTSTNGASNNMQAVIFNGPDYDQSGTLTSGLNNWLLCVVRKPTGSVAARWSIRNMTTGTWTHFNTGDTTLANWTAIGGTGIIRLYDTDQWPALRIAARALWANEVKWSADSTGDSQIEAAGLHTASSNWLAATPGLAHFFDQASTSDPVNDWVGSADQTAIAGTSVITDDDPPGFTFDHDSGQSVAISAATETDSAGTVGKAKRKTLGVATETDSAGAVVRRQTRTVGTASTSDTAGAVGRAKRRTLGIAAETDTAGAVTSTKATAAGIAAETDTAGTVTSAKAATMGTAAETDAALPIASQGFIRTVTTATETDLAGALGRAKAKAVSTAAETDTAGTVTPVKPRTVGMVAETDTALPLGRVHTITIGTATDVSTAGAVTGYKARLLGVAAELDTALPITRPSLGPGRGTPTLVKTSTVTRPSTSTVTRPRRGGVTLR